VGPRRGHPPLFYPIHPGATNMHDAKGRELKVGDTVIVPCEVTAVHPTPDCCNVTVQTLGGRLPDGNKDRFTTNTKHLLRANAGDDTSIELVEDNGKTFLK
jgi:hypothetical protein